MKWKNAFNLYRGERIGLFVLLGLIAITIVVNTVLSFYQKNSVKIIQNEEFEREYQAFRTTLKEKEELHPTYSKDKKYAHNHREDYSSDEKKYAPHTAFVKQEKLASGEQISVNESDTAEWKKIPGIGSAYAQRIVKYQESLGGYTSVNQLKEVYGMTDELFEKIEPFVREEGNVQKIKVNQWEFKQLLRHPYLEYNQVKAIFDLRKRKGRVASVEQLSLLEEFSDKDMERLRPYLDFE